MRGGSPLDKAITSGIGRAFVRVVDVVAVQAVASVRLHVRCSA